MSLVLELEHLIRSGQFEKAEKLVAAVGKVERKDAVAFANIARRLKREDLAARILNPIVRSTNKLQAPASPIEKLEYADVLRQLGAVNEARALLREIDSKTHSRALLFEGFCYISEWQYRSALLVLKEYLWAPGISPYDQTVASINIIAALIQIGSLDEADQNLAVLRRQTMEQALQLLHGNCLELSGQVAILRGDFDQALDYLRTSSQVLKDANKVSLQTDKWIAIASSLKAGVTLSSLSEVLASAADSRRWEIVRDCEFYMAFIQQDEKKFQQLYFGTPYESFRDRVLRFAGPSFQVPETFLFGMTDTPTITLDLATGQIVGRPKDHMPLGQSTHRLLIILFRDLYKAVPVMTVFGQLFPDEFMNTATSPNRVHQIVRRCRQQLKKLNLPIHIDEIDGTYRLILGTSVGVLLPREPLPLLKEEIEILFLYRKFGSKPFKSLNAQDALARSSTATNLLLLWGIENGFVSKSGFKKSTTYQVVPRLRTAKAG